MTSSTSLNVVKRRVWWLGGKSFQLIVGSNRAYLTGLPQRTESGHGVARQASDSLNVDICGRYNRPDGARPVRASRGSHSCQRSKRRRQTKRRKPTPDAKGGPGFRLPSRS